MDLQSQFWILFYLLCCSGSDYAEGDDKNQLDSLATQNLTTKDVKDRIRQQRQAKGPIFDTSKYLDSSEIEAYLESLSKAYPNTTKLQIIGYTHEKRPITVVKVGEDGNKPAFWIDAGIHAREWIAPSTALYMLNKLVTELSNAQYLKKVTWYFLPLMNPDGYNYSRSSTNKKEKMWRKNRKPETCSGKKCCMGVDLNRNFGYSFGGASSSNDPCSDVYSGPSAFSEPESRAVRDFVLQHSKIRAAVTLHSNLQKWFYPFSDKKRSLPADWKELDALAKKAASALTAVRGTTYPIGTAADIYHASGGGSYDWMKEGAGVKYTYCLELPSAAGGYFPPPTTIPLVGEETWAAIKVIAGEIGGVVS